MANVEEILDDPKISEFLKTHQGAAGAIERAADEVAQLDDAIRCIRKLLPALSERVVPIFFSYKKKDERAAKEIVKILRTNSAEKLQITYQADFAREIAGKKWREEIYKSIQNASWFILLLPDPSDDWDWCLFETGLFEAQRTSCDRLICLHHPDTRIPSQIEGYHAVPATIPDVEEFLHMVYVKESPIPGMKPINRALESQIPALAKQIVEAIRPPRKPYYRQVFEPWVEVKLNDAASLENTDDLDNAVIVSANLAALDMFGFIDAPKTWGELRSSIQEKAGDGRWRAELFHVLRRIANGRRFFPVQAVFQADSGKMYRPVACAIDRLGGETGPIETYHITFSEDIAAVDHAFIPEDLAGLATLLRFAFRFRWEVLERFTKEPMTESDIERLDSAFKRMKVEWSSRGGGDANAVVGMFPQGSQRDQFSHIVNQWKSIRNPEGTGELDVAIEQNDVRKAQEILRRIIPMNQEFLEMTTAIFAERIHAGS